MNLICIDPNGLGAATKIASVFDNILDDLNYNSRPVCFFCIGNDRVIGDSFGPLVGFELSSLHYNGIYVYGTLDQPVNTSTYAKVLDSIYALHDNPFIIAVDSSMSQDESLVGKIVMGIGPLEPGEGVGKRDIMPVGDMFIKGVVNSSNLKLLASILDVRLSFVMKLANVTCAGIIHALAQRAFMKCTAAQILEQES